MLLILLFFTLYVVFASLGLFSAYIHYKDISGYISLKELLIRKNNELISGAIIMLGTCILVCGLILSISYINYLELVGDYVTITQYKEAITMYEDKIILNVNSLTDFAYTGHPAKLSELITSLRRKVVLYNSSLATKRVLKKNIFFNWLIVPPDNYMKPVSLITESRGK